ncbi:uncharacterized protein LOC123224136 [Mangifera indica]|uniref:uncharacterized protein LOC123224136 n=1 Tax=Mangifera indica TaxID=29780 RepID=UPI001CFB6AEA|nr:uncharacterized protein LOC123224136 [Mangifera indica]XP_044503620.1 uncharacterized protein LOC123224136 [Mangifera indica]XP_044503621.1 uncharacterized protein LOC123224136 [Mangifera indica]
MDLSSWFRRSPSISNGKRSKTPQSSVQKEDQEELLILGVTEQLIDHVKSFTLETFKNFPLQDDDDSTYDVEATTNSSGNVQQDLSDWQERHAILVLSKVKELAQLRFKLCPRHLKEQQFWRIYFMLVKSHVAEYELQAIRLAKLKSMAMENEKTSDSSVYEVEMAETKQAASLSPPTP